MSGSTKRKSGYGHPPPEHRFQPGQSGNPAGRPKGRKNFKTIVQNILNRPMDVTIGSKHTTMTAAEAVLHSLVKSALSGNTRAQAAIVTLMQSHLNDPTDGVSDPQLINQELQVVNQILARRERER